jgi:hypothetical protein
MIFLLYFLWKYRLLNLMKIRERTGKSRKQKAYLKWMGLTPPRSSGRLKQLNKHNRKSLHKPSEAQVMFRLLDEKEGV